MDVLATIKELPVKCGVDDWDSENALAVTPEAVEAACEWWERTKGDGWGLPNFLFAGFDGCVHFEWAKEYAMREVEFESDGTMTEYIRRYPKK